MLTAADIVQLPFTDDLADAGIEYAVRSLAHSSVQGGKHNHYSLYHTAGDFAAEVAFRRFLNQQGVRFRTEAVMPFRGAEGFQVVIGRRRCQIKSLLVTNPQRARALERDPEMVLKELALVPLEEHAGEGQSDEDIYLFTFQPARLGLSAAGIHKLVENKRPVCMLYCMPGRLTEPPGWHPIGPFTLQAEPGGKFCIQLIGLDGSREPLVKVINLLPNRTVRIDEPYFSLAALSSSMVISSTLKISLPRMSSPLVIRPHEWANTRLYGTSIILAGFMTRREFEKKALPLLPGRLPHRASRQEGKILSVKVSELRPITEFIDAAPNNLPRN